MDVSPSAFLITYTGIQLLAAMSPGPAFAVVTQRSLHGGRWTGLGAAIGCTLGLFLWLCATMIGLAFVVSKFWWLYASLRVGGGLFLIYLAYKLWRHARDPFAPTGNSEGTAGLAGNPFFAGLFVQLSNPKALAYCVSVLVTLLPPVQPLWMKLTIPVLGGLVEGSWWLCVALAFSASPFRKAYAGLKTYLDRTMGTVLAVLGLKLLLTQP